VTLPPTVPLAAGRGSTLEPDHSLALAVVISSTAPLLLLDAALDVIAASLSFCAEFALQPAEVIGRPISEVGHGEWNLPRLRTLLGATLGGGVDIEAYELDIRSPNRGIRRLVLNAKVMEYDFDAGPKRLLLSVNDVTDARKRATDMEELLREKAVLLQEVQHRVANSLQIVASVLMQSAKKVQSEETRTHLRDAHNRVMSIAALQRQLAASNVAEVPLAAYLSQLCETLGASMIADHDQIKIAVDADDSAVAADASVSLGLIVTELVINALKHAFDGRGHGRIVVGYHRHAGGWALTVADDGVGMHGSLNASGLGTSIVNALARHLHADIVITDAKPGALVSVISRVAIDTPANDPAV